ncbi:hypothetical protein ACTHQ2_24370, partial [Bacillus subtilis]|uniref:hypothetical protein n=1 Tax=Bacillus subtilis TaxID=1423 RepID=UPI003F7BB42E
VYKITDIKTGEEVLFREEELDDQQFEYAEGQFCYVNHFYKCVIDEKDAYKMIPNEKFHEKSNYTVSYEVGDCMKWIEPGKPVIIEHDEFVDILKNNFTKFDLTVNKPTQSTSYYAVEVSPIIPTQ